MYEISFMNPTLNKNKTKNTLSGNKQRKHDLIRPLITEYPSCLFTDQTKKNKQNNKADL